MAADNTAQWYNALIEHCNLDPQTFQLVQGTMVVETTSEFLWNILDAVPPKSISHLYNPSQANIFSTNYGAIITSLNSNSLVDAARMMWKKAGGFSGVKAYNQTIRNLIDGLEKVGGFSFTYDSSAEPLTASHSWAEERVQPMQFFLQGDGFDSEESSPTDGPTVVEVEIEHLLTFAAGPYAKKSTQDVVLVKLDPWYNSAALNLAYQMPRSFNEKGYWKIYFGPDKGSMLRRCSDLVVVDGLTTKVIKSPKGDIRSKGKPADVCFWPFWKIHGGPDEMGVEPLKIGPGKYQTPVGNPQILGVDVTPLPDYLGG